MAIQMNLVRYTMFVVIWSQALSAPTSDVTSSRGQSLNGDTLVSLGTKLKNPLLKLVGLALLNSQNELLCKLHLCGEWSSWSACSVARLDTFGVRNRTRKCGGTKSPCETNTPKMTQVETSLCEGFCPPSYNYTEGGYCLRYVHKKVSPIEAENACKSDGGFLININSQKKLDNVKTMLEDLPKDTNIWVDGKRSSNTSPWVFSYEEDKQDFTNWVSHDPDNSAKELCLIYKKDTSEGWKRFDALCRHDLYILCEITLSV